MRLPLPFGRLVAAGAWTPRSADATGPTFDAAVRYAVPLTMFVMNDDGYGQERHDMRATGLDPTHAAVSPGSAEIAAAMRGER